MWHLFHSHICRRTSIGLRKTLRQEDKESVNDGDGGTRCPSAPPPLPPPPFNMPDMAQFWANATQFMTTMMAAMPRQGKRNERVDCSSTNFFRHNLVVFDGSSWPLAPNNWISNFQTLLMH